MGARFCKRAEPPRMLFMGLGGAGKTTLLYHLIYGTFVTAVPAAGRGFFERFHLGSLRIYGEEMACPDFASRSKFRVLFQIQNYVNQASCIVYVINSTDRDKLNIALDELIQENLLDKETSDKVYMVLANKQDLEAAMPAKDIETALKRKLDEAIIKLQQTMFVYPVSAKSGDGLTEAFKFCVELADLKRRNRAVSGLISLDTVDKKLGNKELGPDSTKQNNLAKRVFRDPVNYLKSILFY